jgi:hypothetical protein
LQAGVLVQILDVEAARLGIGEGELLQALALLGRQPALDGRLAQRL